MGSALQGKNWLLQEPMLSFQCLSLLEGREKEK